MIQKILLVFVVFLIAIGGAGFIFYNNYYMAPERVLARATEAFNKINTAHAELEITTSTRSNTSKELGATQDSKITGTMDINLREMIYKIHMVISSKGNSIDMDAVILKDGQMYMRMPLVAEQWFSLNLKTLKEEGNLPFDPQSSDYVTQSLGFMKSLEPGSVLKLEDEIVDGTKTSHYRVDVSNQKYMDFVKSFETGTELAEAYADASIKSDIWLDIKSNRIVKMETDIKNMKVNDPKTKVSLGVTDMHMKVVYSRYNQSVEIAKPTGEIIDYQELLDAIKQEPVR